MRSLPMPALIKFWDEFETAGRKKNNLIQVVRALALCDLYYLLVRVCHREDMLHPWVYARVREVEASPNNHLDLWARGHFKSSTITFGLTIQDVLKDPEITVGIFSHTRPIAKAFLRQIMREFESNKILHNAFPDILWGTEIRQSPKWSEDEGILLKRKSNPPEATIEAWGLVDGQPTSRHFKVLLYDDIVVESSVTTPDMIAKTMKAVEQSYNLSNENFVRRFAGTRWHFGDAYKTIKDRGTAIAREHPGTDDGTEDGKPVFWTPELMAAKRRDMGPHTFAAQILLNPKADALQGFKREWMRHYQSVKSDRMNKYILVDPASRKSNTTKAVKNDFTTMWVVGLHTDKKYYILDIVRDRLNLTERTKRLFDLHREYHPMQVRYEDYGMQADIEHIRTAMESENYRFDITPVAGQVKKTDRIGRLIPLFEQGQFYFPESLYKTDYQKTTVNLVKSFIEEELAPFPVGLHDDMLDSLARIVEPDLTLTWPKEVKKSLPPPPPIAESATAWMS